MTKSDDLSLSELRDANIRRANEFIPMSKWTLDQRLTELVEEVGELAGRLKRLNRMDEGMYHRSDVSRADLMEQMADELADVQITLDLFGAKAGIDLACAVRKKFNKTSAKHGLSVYL